MNCIKKFTFSRLITRNLNCRKLIFYIEICRRTIILKNVLLRQELLRKMCAIKTSSSLFVVTIQNSVVKSDLSLATLCSEGATGLLSWIPWQDFIEKIRPFLNADEVSKLKKSEMIHGS